ncbi:hypothetical protein ACS0LS_004260 [Escherichia coli]|uniref:hypothetical protein n=1 Tax=Escherichia coli TaxID=562 RepID=UPI0015F17C86|nr:hypothetical protein [Escherichia coli]EFG9132400.1 hypothetical protein [Escherichia coli]HAH8858467.1 hypothetical protein [Escherichia coli]
MEKDSFFAQILHEASNEAGGGLFYRFWENWGNTKKTRDGTIHQKGFSVLKQRAFDIY